MMKKQITFEAKYDPTSQALEWLTHLSECFKIKKATLRMYTKPTAYSHNTCCQIIVYYE